MIQIRQNGKYKLRDGRTVGPAERNQMFNVDYPWIINGWLYNDNGKSYSRKELDVVEDLQPKIRGEVISIENGVATVKLLDPAPTVTGSYRIVIATPLGNVDGVVFIGSDSEKESDD